MQQAATSQQLHSPLLLNLCARSGQQWLGSGTLHSVVDQQQCCLRLAEWGGSARLLSDSLEPLAAIASLSGQRAGPPVYYVLADTSLFVYLGVMRPELACAACAPAAAFARTKNPAEVIGADVVDEEVGAPVHRQSHAA